MACDLELVLAGKTKSFKRYISVASPVILVLSMLAVYGVHSFNASPTMDSTPSFINDESMRFVRISAGSAPIGDSSVPPSETAWQNEPYVRADRPFYMSATPVTQHEYLRVIGHLPSDRSQIDLDAPVQGVT